MQDQEKQTTQSITDFRVVSHPTESVKYVARLMLEMGSENARNHDLAKYFEKKSQHLQDENQLLRNSLDRAYKAEENRLKLLEEEHSAHKQTKVLLDIQKTEVERARELIAKMRTTISNLKEKFKFSTSIAKK